VSNASVTRTFGGLKASLRSGLQEPATRGTASRARSRRNRLAIRITDIRVALDFPEEDLLSRVLAIIGVSGEEVDHFSIVRRGLDARRKGQVIRVYAVECSLRSDGLEEEVCARVGSARRASPSPDPFPPGKVRKPSSRPVVVGAGPAGLFAALTLARFGAPPLLLERGRPVEERSRNVAAFWKTGSSTPRATSSSAKRRGDVLRREAHDPHRRPAGFPRRRGLREFAGLPGLGTEASLTSGPTG
jgi:hypothetical protein